MIRVISEALLLRECRATTVMNDISASCACGDGNPQTTSRQAGSRGRLHTSEAGDRILSIPSYDQPDQHAVADHPATTPPQGPLARFHDYKKSVRNPHDFRRRSLLSSPAQTIEDRGRGRHV